MAGHFIVCFVDIFRKAATADRIHGKTGLTTAEPEEPPASGKRIGFCGKSGRS
jgi:hypothetical protein